MKVELDIEKVWVIRPIPTGTLINYNGSWIEVNTNYDELIKGLNIV